MKLNASAIAWIVMLVIASAPKAVYSQEPEPSVWCNRWGIQIGESRGVAFGFFRGFLINRHGLPAFRPIAQIGITGPHSFVVAKGSVFHVDGKYFQVTDLERKKKRKDIKGCLYFIELPEKPHCIHICNRPKD